MEGRAVDVMGTCPVLKVTSGLVGAVLCAAAERQRMRRRVARMVADLWAEGLRYRQFLPLPSCAGTETMSYMAVCKLFALTLM